MLKSFIATIFALLAATFGLHHSAVTTAPISIAQSAHARSAQLAASAEITTQTPTITTPHFQDLSSFGTSSTASAAQGQGTPEPGVGAQASAADTPNAFNTASLQQPTNTDFNSKLNTLASVVGNIVTLLPTLRGDQQQAAVYIPLGDGAPNTIAAASNIGQLNGVTITNANLTASEIPDLSGDYLSLSGGGVTGTSTFPALGIGTSSPGSIFSIAGVGNWTSATSTYYSSGGINLTAGCFSINGTCITGGGSSSLTIGTTPISGGTNGDILGIGTGGSAGELVDSGISSTMNGVPSLFIGGNPTAQQYNSYGGGAGNPLSGVASQSTESTAFGYDAENANDQGGANSGFGTLALSAVTSGTENTGIGTHSGKLITTGSFNTAVGSDTFFTATTAVSNSTAVGSHALYAQTAGTNDAFGANAGASITTSSLNVAIGGSALNLLVAGNGGNVAVGASALANTTAGAKNTAVGNDAGLGSSGNENSLFGYLQGYGLTSGSGNVFVGSCGFTAACYNQVTSGSNNISIGFQVAVHSATASNQLDIGNFIYGTGLSGTGASISPGSIGIGTTTPYSRLEVWGPDTASTTAFAVVNSASTTVFAVFDSGNSTYSGSIFQSSDQRLKTNVQSLDASSSLAAIEALNPVSYLRLDQPGTGENLGFIAQQVGNIFPELVSTTSATALTPDGTLTLNYEGLIAPIVKAIQDIASISGDFKVNLIAWLANANNGIGKILAGEVDTQKLCVGSTCINQQQLTALLASQNAGSSGQGSDSSGVSATSTPDTPPVIQINGDNPAIVQVSATYNDLGATITGPQADLNLGIETYLNGALTSPVQLDTSQPATDTIDYVVTDGEGNTATSTRTVIIQAPSGPAAAATSTQTAT